MPGQYPPEFPMLGWYDDYPEHTNQMPIPMALNFWLGLVPAVTATDRQPRLHVGLLGGFVSVDVGVRSVLLPRSSFRRGRRGCIC